MDEYKLASRYIAERFATEPPSDAAFWPEAANVCWAEHVRFAQVF
jgi:hypothetical protein